MKSYLTKLFNSSIFCHVQRLMIVCFFCSLVVTASAGDDYYRPAVSVSANPSTGAGSVYVSLTEGNKTSQTATANDGAYAKSGRGNSTKFYFYADHTNADYLWYGWISKSHKKIDAKNPSLELNNNNNDYGYNSTQDKKDGYDTYNTRTYPFTGTWVQPDVTGFAGGTANGERQSILNYTITNPTPSDATATFTLSNDYAGLKDINDEEPASYYEIASPLNTNGFTSGSISHTKGSGSLSIPVTYTPTGVHNQTNSASLTVQSLYPANRTKNWTVVYSVKENYKPSFTLSDSYNFTPTTPIKNATSSNMYALPITNRNYAAENVAEWEVSWSDVTYAGGAYTLENPYIVDVTANGGQTPTVTFIASAEGSYMDIQATLTIKCKYRDASGNLIESDPQTITFSADVGDAVKIDDVKDANYNFGQVTYDGSIHTHSLSYATNMTGLVLSWQSGTYFEHQIDGENIVISLKSTAIPADYTDRLSVKSGETEVASLSVSAQVRLAKPELEANGDVKSVLLEWNEVYGATKYIIKSGANEIETLTAADALTAGYEYTVNSIAGTPVVIGQSYSFTVTAVYGEDALIATKISVSDEKTASPSEYPYTITTDNASKDKLGMATGLKNGLKVNGDVAKYNPSKAQWDVDVTSTFDANGNALFDRLYIFGLTTGPSGGDVQGYAGVTMPNAITPCYIYEKRNDGKAYEHKATIDNMNTDTKNSTWFDLKLSGNEKKKIYLTGWCPYGSTGVTINEHGLLYVTGNNSNQIDIYLENCYLYSRIHKRDNGLDWGSGNFDYELLDYTGWNILSAVNVITEDGLDEGAKGAASAIVIEATGNTAFPANIHIKGDNLVFGHRGASLWVKVDAELGSFSVKVDQSMGHYSAPIYVRPKDKKKITTLTMDDKWPTDATYQNIYHTNGYLKFEKELPAGPSIDLGNNNTTLNFNGGRFELEASLPTQDNYPNNLAICVRNGEFTYEGMPDGLKTYVYYGLAGDATGGTVNINDGSVWVTKFTPKINKWSGAVVNNSDFFDDIFEVDGVEYSNTLRLPGKTYVRGGSHKGYLRACSDLASSGSTPTDGPTDGNSYLEQRVYEVKSSDLDLSIDTNNDGILDNGFVKETFFTGIDPIGLFKSEKVTPSTNGATEMLLETYYTNNSSNYSSVGGSYGRASILPVEGDDGKKRIYLWVPGQAKHPITFTKWFLSLPYIKADLSEGLLAQFGLNLEFGTEDMVPYEQYTQKEGGGDKHVVKNLWRIEMDENLLAAAEEVGKLPAKVADKFQFVDLNDQSFRNGMYQNIMNENDYLIKNSIYSFRMIKADDWMLFCPQFDVKNIYILEACDEAYLKNLSDVTPIANGGGRENALLAQAVLNLDMTSLIGIDLSATTNDKPFWDYYSRYTEYVNYIKNFTGDDSDIEMRKPFYQSYNPELNLIRTKLEHLVKKGDGSFNYSDAHYYLYQTDATDWWIDPETGILKINWQLAPASTKAADGTTDVVMKKGQVYAMQFPYCPGCEYDPETGIIGDRDYWDYWTGKMIVFEGEGPQTLSGTNKHAEIKATTADGFHGNYTFSDISVSNTEMKNAYFNYAGYMMDNAEGAVESLRSGESFVILPESVHSKMPGKRITSINPQTGAITWEDDNNTTTGTPTISGDRQMMVYTIEGGVGIIPVIAQQVSIYNAAGQLITSQYLTDEVQISLPTGIYLVSGEKDQAKVIVK